MEAQGEGSLPYRLDLTGGNDDECLNEHTDTRKHDRTEPSKFGLGTTSLESAGEILEFILIKTG
jgi:hypothetical protein